MCLTMDVVRIHFGEKGKQHMPFSEVCCYMNVAGKEMDFELMDDSMVQLFDPGGSPYSFPITSGEAGLYRDEEGYYYCPDLGGKAA